MLVSLKIEYDWHSADRTLIFCLYPLKKTLIMEQMSTSSQFSTIKKLIHANNANLIRSRLIFLENPVHPLYQLVISPIFV